MTREGRPTYKSGRPIDQTSQFASCHSTIVWTRGPTNVCNSILEDFDSVWLLAVALIASLYTNPAPRRVVASTTHNSSTMMVHFNPVIRRAILTIRGAWAVSMHSKRSKTLATELH